MHCTGTAWPLQVGMATALFFGLGRGESTVVVLAYYISMNVVGSLQVPGAYMARAGRMLGACVT